MNVMIIVDYYYRNIAWQLSFKISQNNHNSQSKLLDIINSDSSGHFNIAFFYCIYTYNLHNQGLSV